MYVKIIGLGIAVVATAAVYSVGSSLLAPADPYAPCRDTEQSAMQSVGGAFTLVGQGGKTLSEKEVFTEPTLLYFGYTLCPDVCPLDNFRNSEAIELAENSGLNAKAVFVTIDPERDTEDVMAEYTDYFDGDMQGLTGSAEQVAQAAEAYGVVYEKRESDDPEFYLVDHSTLTYVVLPDVGAVDVVRRSSSPEDVASKLLCFAKASGSV
ncbi:MAG: SCO family protein [Pseudomonadota bacterium]